MARLVAMVLVGLGVPLGLAAGPLHTTARSGDADAATALIASGADVDEREATGEAPLHVAAGTGEAGVARLLIASDADLDVRDDDGLTPLHKAAMSGIMRAIATGVAGTAAEREARAAVADVLISAGADVNAETKKGQTPLHFAVLGNAAVVAALIAGDARLDARDAKGLTPLHGAAGFFQVAAVRALIAAGADVDATDKAGATPLDKANATQRSIVESGREDDPEMRVWLGGSHEGAVEALGGAPAAG